MFLNGMTWDSRSGQHSYGSFLVIFDNHERLRPSPTSDNTVPELRALVRHVRMNQLGHWMMGTLRLCINGENIKITLSGAYGADGLPVSIHEVDLAAPLEPGKGIPMKEKWPGLWDRLHPVPDELQVAFWKGGGHNTSGSEGPLFHRWARENIQVLRRLREVRCKFCKQRVPIVTAHRHAGGWVGDACCWDDRLRNSE